MRRPSSVEGVALANEPIVRSGLLTCGEAEARSGAGECVSVKMLHKWRYRGGARSRYAPAGVLAFWLYRKLTRNCEWEITLMADEGSRVVSFTGSKHAAIDETVQHLKRFFEGGAQDGDIE